MKLSALRWIKYWFDLRIDVSHILGRLDNMDRRMKDLRDDLDRFIKRLEGDNGDTEI